MGIILGMALPYVAFGVFVVGTLLRIVGWMRIPVPFHLTLFPVPEDKAGSVRELVLEFVLCRSIYREDRLLWLWVWLFHVSLLMIVCGHVLGIYFLRQQFTLVGLSSETSQTLSVLLGGVAGAMMTLSLGALLCRRLFRREVRGLSEPDHYFELILLLAISVTGIAMYLPGLHAELPEVRAYMAGLLLLDPVPLPRSSPFFVHFLLVNLLMLYFPFSRLLHSAGFFVNRAMLAEAPPVYPTPDRSRPRSDFSSRKIHPDIPCPMNVADKESGSK
jgi:nitrate reductase gamma subunit